MNQTMDVAVIGAGIAGNALAKSLADCGWETLLFERKAFPRHKVCGEFLSPESLSMINVLGVSEVVESLKPTLIERTRLFVNDEHALEIPFSGTALGVSRFALDSTLLSAATSSGVHVMTETTVTSVNLSDKCYTIETNKGGKTKIYNARAVIAAWGTNGFKRVDRPNLKKAYVGVKSHYRGLDMEPVVDLYFFDGGYVGISPIEGGMVNVAALLDRKTFLNKPKSILGWIEAACSRNKKLHDKLVNAISIQGTQAAVAPIDLNRQPSPWDSFPNVGDAALMIPPLCGDGMSMALRSSQLCASLADRYLKGDISLTEWQHDYTNSIHQQFNGPRQWGRFFQWLISVPHLPQLLLPVARFSPKLAHKFVQVTRLKENKS